MEAGMTRPIKIGPIVGALALCAGAGWTSLAGAGEAPAAYYPSLGYGQVPPWTYAEAPGHGQVPAAHDRALVYGGPPPGYVGEPAYGSDFGPEGGIPEPEFAPGHRAYGPPREEGYDSGWVERERAGPDWRSYSGSRVQTYDYDSGWRGSVPAEREIGPPQPLPPVGHGNRYSDGRSWRPCCAPPPPCPPRRCVRPMAHHQPSLRLNDRFFVGSGGVGPAYFSGSSGGGGVYVVSGGGGRASANSSAFASASARASASVRGRGRVGGHGGGHCCGK
jgi:hypothetical protein